MYNTYIHGLQKKLLKMVLFAVMEVFAIIWRHSKCLSNSKLIKNFMITYNYTNYVYMLVLAVLEIDQCEILPNWNFQKCHDTE